MFSLGDGVFMRHANSCYAESPHISLQTRLDASARTCAQVRARVADGSLLRLTSPGPGPSDGDWM